MNFIIFILALLCAGCGTFETYKTERESPSTVVITGEFDRDVLQSDDVCKVWYEQHYAEYRIDSVLTEEIGRMQKNISYIIVAGTWCGDSKRQLPGLFKIFDAAEISENQLRMFGVDRTKKSDNPELEKYMVQYVPTIIVLRNEQEIGRIVESPTETLEEDLVSILRRP